MLGLVPGWGGAYLVPNLVGADNAVTLILENPLNQGKTLERRRRRTSSGSPTRASRAPTSSSSRCSGRPTSSPATVDVERPEVDRGEAWDAAVARGRADRRGKTGGASPAADRRRSS